MRKIYILISQTGSLFSKGIRWYTKQPYNHSSITTDKHFPVFWSFARRWPRLPFPGSFVKEEFNKGTFALFPDTDCVVLAFEIEDEKAKKADAILDKHINRKKRYGYNYSTIFSTFLFHKPTISKRKRRTCAEFVALVLSESDIHSFDKQLQMVHPMDIFNNFSENIIYRGKMRDIKESDFLQQTPFNQ
ncbi:MAG: hypothetical protein GYA87_09095 [Christensenellaceae bacterium]|nr:hypothetical protein [Christensenellaceae bacterium]